MGPASAAAAALGAAGFEHGKAAELLEERVGELEGCLARGGEAHAVAVVDREGEDHARLVVAGGLRAGAVAAESDRAQRSGAAVGRVAGKAVLQAAEFCGTTVAAVVDRLEGRLVSCGWHDAIMPQIAPRA